MDQLPALVAGVERCENGSAGKDPVAGGDEIERIGAEQAHHRAPSYALGAQRVGESVGPAVVLLKCQDLAAFVDDERPIPEGSCRVADDGGDGRARRRDLQDRRVQRLGWLAHGPCYRTDDSSLRPAIAVRMTARCRASLQTKSRTVSGIAAGPGSVRTAVWPARGPGVGRPT